MGQVWVSMHTRCRSAGRREDFGGTKLLPTSWSTDGRRPRQFSPGWSDSGLRLPHPGSIEHHGCHQPATCGSAVTKLIGLPVSRAFDTQQFRETSLVTRRWFPASAQSLKRSQNRDTELFGVRVREGQKIMSVIEAANRDPKWWNEYASKYDISRSASGHL
ncbi:MULTISPECIES: hypothetical protein [Nocardiaceae]|uniref:hypothetical protein n=1 Tax=Nocardiaceae TaxID=85025 RepID=UPI00117A289E|nr:hypothetical protein [Rhodococcus sp. 06-221-2]